MAYLLCSGSAYDTSPICSASAVSCTIAGAHASSLNRMPQCATAYRKCERSAAQRDNNWSGHCEPHRALLFVAAERLGFEVGRVWTAHAESDLPRITRKRTRPTAT